MKITKWKFEKKTIKMLERIKLNVRKNENCVKNMKKGKFILEMLGSANFVKNLSPKIWQFG